MSLSERTDRWRQQPPRPPRDGNRLLKTGEVARWLQISPRTVLAWALDGRLPSTVTPGKHRRYRWADVEALRVEMGPRNEHTGERVP